MEKLKKILIPVFSGIISVITIFVLGYLTLLSFLSTSNITDKELTYFCYDDPMIIMFGILFILVLAVVFYRLSIKNKIKTLTDKGKKPLFILFVIFAVAIVLSGQLSPTADQGKVLEIAQQMREHNFIAFREGGYVNRCSNQIGIITIFYFLSFIFGNFNFIAIQIINVVALCVSVYIISKFINYWNETKFTQNLTLFSLFIFFPITYYVTFVYGNLIGLALSLIGIDLVYKYFKTRKVHFALLSCLSLGVSILAKSNYLITLIAVVIFILLDALKSKSIISLLLAIIMPLSYYAINLSVVNFIETKTGYEFDYGCPNTGYIAMGLQEAPAKAEGWFNFYNWNVYEKNNYDTEVANEKAIENIKESISEFKSGKRDFIEFFGRKNASQWNNPTFQGINIQQNHYSDVQYYSSFYELFFGTRHLWQYGYLNFLQSFILLFALLYFIFTFNKKDIMTFLPVVVLLGGFIFHTIWEAKCQYTVTYFIFLFPYAILGFKEAVIRSSNTYELIVKNRGNEKSKDFYKCVSFLVVLLIIVVALSGIFVSNESKIFNLGGDDLYWSSHIEGYNAHSPINDGLYKISPLGNEEYSISLEEENDLKGTNVIVSENSKERIYITSYKNKSKFIFDSSNLAMDVTGKKEVPGANVQQWRINPTSAQKFVIKKVNEEQDIYIIKFGEKMALTYDPETFNVYIDKYSGDENQKWVFSKH